MGTVTVSKKGWVVIPREIRERYGICPGDKVRIVDLAGSIAIFREVADPIQAGFGMFKDGPSMTKALLEDRRWELEDEERDLPPPRSQS